MSDVMQRGASQVPTGTSYIVGRYLAALYITMCAGCFSWCRMRLPWVAKKKSTESKLPEVSANYVAQFLLTHRCIQKLESEPAILPATMLAENFVNPNPDEVRWSVHLRYLSNVHIWIQQLSQNIVPTKADYAMATVKEVLTLAQSAASVIPIPFLKEAIVVALRIIQLCEVR